MSYEEWIRKYYAISSNYEMIISKFGKGNVLREITNLINDPISNSQIELKEKLLNAEANLVASMQLEEEAYEKKFSNIM